jgi:nucleoside-diphosphate-sugar epimerase
MLLSGIMSGGSEANFELGYAVNVDSHLNLLRATHAHATETGQTGAKNPAYVFVSSLAIYGGPGCTPLDRVDPRKTPLHPGTSYGVEKHITELYTYDYGRKGARGHVCMSACADVTGYLDTRSVRLPTVCIRPGAVSPYVSSAPWAPS